MSLDLLLPNVARSASQVMETVLKHAFVVAIACPAIWILYPWLHASFRQVRTTDLRGPPSESFLYGVGKRLLDSEDGGAIYEAWAQEYGPIYAAPSGLGQNRIILCDPKALAHFYTYQTWTYILTPFGKETIALSVRDQSSTGWAILTSTKIGKGIIWAHGEDHKRQRRSLMPAFSIAAIRQLMPVFYDCVYKTKGSWDALIESNGGNSAIIDVQNWMNHISLDTIGLAGFSHDFGTLEGKHSDVAEVLDEFNAAPKGKTALDSGIMTLGLVFPFLAWIPTERTKLIAKLDVALGSISNVLLARTQKEVKMGFIEGQGEKSIVGSLIKGASADSSYHLTPEEVMAQMKLLLVAGYETTSVSLSWALLELARDPDAQAKLRNELFELGSDPDLTYDQLTNNLPYLDAVVNEILRLHSPFTEFTRIACKDDVVPLSQPIRTKSGKLVDTLTIAKGTLIGISIECIHCCTAFWGEDAKTFRPSRWLEDGEHGGVPDIAKKIQGYRHLLTFSEGPRTCLGKHFAVAEIKVALSVLIKNFVFELRDGINTKIEIGRGVLPRPTIAGEVGCKLPLRVRPYAT